MCLDTVELEPLI